MGGAIAEGNMTPAAEFNIWADPEAARRVFASGDRPDDGRARRHAQGLMTPEHADRSADRDGAAKLVAELFDFYHRFHKPNLRPPGSPIHDALALAHVLQPDLLETVERHVAIDCESRALPRADGRRPLAAHRERAKCARRGRRRRGQAFIDLLLERIASLG